MSQLSQAWELAPAEQLAAPPALPWVEPVQRSILQPILMALPLLLATGGYLFTSPQLVDLSFLLVTALCIIFLFGDLRRFSERFGLGGIVLFGGILIWFCYDYLETWFLAWTPHWTRPITESVVARAAACHMLYILCMTIGLRIRRGRWLPKLMTSLAEPRNPSDYFLVVLLTQVIGLLPYFIFTGEPFYLAILHGITGGRGGMGTFWIVGRSGNVNYNWGAYAAQMLQVGDGGAMLASFCLVFVPLNFAKKIICLGVWLLWLGLGFGTGTRGEMVVVLLPPAAFLFIRYHVQAQEFLRKYSLRAYVATGMVLLLAIGVIQTQIHYRNVGFSSINLSQVSFSHIEGNEMFSSSLIGFSYIPELHNYFYDNVPGETLVMPIPNFLYWLAIAPMPRALWHDKPIDSSWEWYNAVFTGRTTLAGGATEGTTIAQGIVGYWFFRFGIAGVIEGGILMGWLMGCAERALLNNRGRCMAVLFSLGIFTWLFRAFRDIALQDLMQIFVALAGIELCIWCLRPFTRAAPLPMAGDEF